MLDGAICRVDTKKMTNMDLVTYQNLRKFFQHSRRVPKYPKIQKYRKYQNLRKSNPEVPKSQKKFGHNNDIK